MSEMMAVKRSGAVEPLCVEKIQKVTAFATYGLKASASEVELKAHIMFFDGIRTDQIHQSLIRSAAELISEESPDYSFVAARLLLQTIYKDVTSGKVIYPSLASYIERATGEGRLDQRMLTHFDMSYLEAHLDYTRDYDFGYLGLQTLCDRYLIRRDPRRDQQAGDLIEMPQHFWMRVAMGLALNEKPDDRNKWAVRFYNLLSQFKFVSSTPTLFNAGTTHAQMSSCYLNSVSDEIGTLGGESGIFNTITECANLSKWAGGIGTDWTNVRPAGDVISGTGGKSSGIIPYLKIFNDTAVAVNQGGKRNGAFAAYLEPWHGDIMRFIDIKKNAGDEHLRAREIFTAMWMNDLFFDRLAEDGDWSLFSPKDCPELHDSYGAEFKMHYERYEAEGKAIRVMKAQELWRAALGALFESGGPWITFKDECNRRNPQSHVGAIRNSNLCTEITEVASDDETAVCNLGSVNLSRVAPSEFSSVIPVAIRMLDNVIDLNFYPSIKAYRSNMRHRPIGLGVMGWTELVVSKGIDWESEAHLQFTNEVFEQLSFWAIYGSMKLARERGAYSSFEGSKWSQGLLPIDTARALPADWASPLRCAWDSLREDVKEHGVRNSNIMAIAPTATISNIVGTTPCIEPTFKHVFTKENHSGVFNVVDPALKYGRKDLCKTAFEIDQMWVIRAAAVRQQWIDQSQSVNLFAKQGTTGKDLEKWYLAAHRLGLKTTYYLKRQIQELDHKSPVMDVKMETVLVDASEEDLIAMGEAKMCSIENPDCESCQ